LIEILGPRGKITPRTLRKIRAVVAAAACLGAVLSARIAGALTVGGTIATATTWHLSDSPVYVTANVTVGGTTLTIEPGVVVKFNAGLGLSFNNGVLSALGTPAAPIYFTSLNDDAVGGAALGSTGAPAVGNWGSLQFAGAASSATLSNVHVRYGGFLSPMLLASAGGSISLSGSEASFSAQDAVQSDAASTIGASNTLFQGNLNWGFNALGAVSTLNGNTFSSSAHGASISLPQTVQADGNTFQDLSVTAMQIDPAVTLNGFQNTIVVRTGLGGTMGIVVNPGVVTQSATWTGSALPYVVRSTVRFGPGASLNITPGATIKLASNLILQGGLTALGSTGQPINFTSLADDSVAGDTNGDGSATTPAPGDWGFVQFDGPNTVQMLSNARFKYGGQFGSPMVVVNASTLTLAGGEFSYSASDGLHSDDATSLISVSSAMFRGNGAWGLNSVGLVPAMIGNTFTTSGDGARITQPQTVQAGGNTFQDLSVLAMQIDPGVTLSGFQNTVAVRTILGGVMGIDVILNVVSVPTTWTGSALPYVMRKAARFAPGAPLTLTPGTIVKLSGGSLNAQGGFSALGSAIQPITFTSLADDSIGGDTNGDGNVSVPAPGDWATVEFDGAANTAALSQVRFRYGGNPSNGNMIAANVGTFSMAGGEISHSQTTGIDYEGAGTVSLSSVTISSNVIGFQTNNATSADLHQCLIFGNSNYGALNNNGAVVDNASYNWWGSTTGPTNASNPGGAGDRVSSFVNFTPYLVSPTPLQAPRVVSVAFLDPTPTQSKSVRFQATFSSAMDTTIAPVATYGLLTPFQTYSATSGGFLSNTVWQSSATIPNSAADGLYFLKLSGAKDTFGNALTVSTFTFYAVDNTPPTVAINAPFAGATLSRPLTVNASAADAGGLSGVVFSVDGATVSTAASPPYSFKWDIRNYPDGNHVLSAVATDLAGNASSTSVAVLLNYAPPAAPVITAPSAGFATSVATINVSGTADPDATVQLQANNVDLDTASVVGGVWKILPETLPSEGTVSLTAIAYDARGFSAPSTPVNGTFSSHAPHAPVLPSASAQANGSVLLSWSAPPAGSVPAAYRVYRSTDDTLLIAGAQPGASLRVGSPVSLLQYADTPAIDDLYFYGVTALDAAGNESPLSNTVYALTDRTPPSAAFLFSTAQPVGLGVYQTSFAISEVLSQPPLVTFTPPGGQPVALNLTAVTATLWQSTMAITADMSSGTATFAFQGVDLAGNVGTAISSGSLLIDTIGPVGRVTLSKTSPLSIGALNFTLTLDEPSVTVPTLAISVQNAAPTLVALASAPPFDGRNWTGVMNVSSTTGDGQAAIAYSGTDRFGNVGNMLAGGTTSFIIDTVAPGAPLVVRGNGLPASQVQLTWSPPLGERPDRYFVYRDAVKLSTTVIPAADGTGSLLDTATNGTHAYGVSSVDLAGNESAATGQAALARSTPPAPPVSVAGAINLSGQIQISWLSGSTDTARFALYRATYTLASAAGLVALNQNALSPFVDAVALDGIYHYAVTAFDSVGNESRISSEAVVTFSGGRPTVAIAGVSDGAYYRANVQPTFTATDLILDPASVKALLDGQPFVSGSTVSVEGAHTLSVSAANTAGRSSTAQASFTLDKTAPQISFSVANGAVITSTSPISVGATVSDLNPGTSTFTLVNETLGTSAPYTPGAAIARNGQYQLGATASDLAGNVATSTIAFTLELGPAAPLNLTVTVKDTAQITWASPEPGVIAYRVYRDGARISASMFPDTLYLDTSFSSGGHVYEVSAVDAAGVEGPRARATIPAATLSLQAPTLTRGFFDGVSLVVQNLGGAALNAGPATLTLIDATGATVAASTAPPAAVPGGQVATLTGVIATPKALTATALVHALVSLPTDPGATVLLAGDLTVGAADPQQPLLEIFPDTLVQGANTSVRIRLYNRGSAPLDVMTAQVLNSTYAPVGNVSVQLQTMQATVLASGGLMQTGNGANITFSGGRQVYFVSVAPGSSVLFDPISVLVPNTATQNLNIVATVSTPTYNLPLTALAATRSFSAALAQNTVAQVPYSAFASPDRAYYDQSSSVTLSGRTFDSSGAALPNVSVVVHILGSGFARTANAVSDSSGNFTAGFFPLPTESGVYNVFATYPTIVTVAVQSTFTIVGYSLQYSNYTAALAQNSSVKFTVDLQNSGASALTGLSASSILVSGSSVALALDGATLPATLPAGGKATLGLTLTALPSATTSNFNLVVTESHGFNRILPVTANVVLSQALPSIAPQQIAIGMVGGDVRTIPLVIQNKGFDTWRGVQLTNPALPWVTIIGSPNLGDIPPGGNVSVTLQFAPPSSLPNQTYAPSPLLQATSQNVGPVPVQAAIALTSARKGDVLVSIINADKPLVNGQGVPIPGSKATLTSLDIPGLIFVVNGDQNGVAAFSSIPSGNYAWRAEAAGFQTQGGTAVVEPGMTNQIQAVLATTVVSYQWSVTPTSIVDQYNILLNLVFKTDVPAPAIIVDPPALTLNMVGGQTTVTQLTITNKGVVSAFNYKIGVSGDPALQISVPFDTIPEIKPGQSIVVPVNIFLVHASCHSSSVGGAYNYRCAAGFTQNSSAPNVSFSAGDCGGGSGDGSGAPPLGAPGSFFATTGSLPVAAAVGSPSLVAPCSKSQTPVKGTIYEAGPAANSGGTNVNSLFGTTSLPGGGMCKASGSPSISFNERYNSFQVGPSPYGPGWSGNSLIQIVGNGDGTFTMVDGVGSQYNFMPVGALNQPLNGSGKSIASPVANYTTLSAPPGVPFSLQNPSLPTEMITRDPEGNTTVFDLYGSTYFPVFFADKNGSYIKYDRDAAGTLLKETDIHGRFLSFTYNPTKQLTAVTDETGRIISYTYNAAGDQTSFTDVNGDVTQYAYDASHLLTQVTYPNGGHRLFTYYPDGTTASESDDNGVNQLSYSYNAASSSTLITDSLGRHRTEWWTEVDGKRKISRIDDAAGGTTRFAFDSQFNVSARIDALGRTSLFTHDSNGNLTSATDANGRSSQIQYMTNCGTVAVGTATAPSGGVACTGGTAGSVQVQVPGHGSVPLSVPVSVPVAVSDPVGNTSHMSYDATFNLIQAQDPVGNSTQLSYDVQGHLTGVKDPLGAVTSASYNGNGAVSSITDALGRKDVMTRDPLSRVTLNTDAAGNQTSFSYDPVGHTTQVKDALNGTTNVAYQAGRSGRFPASVTDAKGHATSFTYDTTGRVTSVKNALNQSASISYNAKSLPVSVQTRKGQTISFAYDSLDRLTTLTAPEGSLSLSYDAVGNLLTANHYNGSALSLSYDALNRVTQVGQTLTNGFTANIGYGYDANGNRTRMTTPWGAFSYAYDALDRITSITNPNGQTVTFNYDAASRRTSMSYPNGTKTTYAYDAGGQVTQIVHQKTSNQTAIAFDNYTYDADGNRIQISDLVGTHTFAYDKLNRLTGANHPGTSSLPTQAETFAYDAIGNRTSDALRTNYTYDAANRIVSDSSFTYTSDANGNQTSRTSRSTGNTTTFVYDSGNRLVQVNGPSGTIATYKYDAAGRRIEKNVGGTITRYIFDGANLLATLDGSNNLTALFTQGPGIDSPLIGRISGTDYFYHADALGSVVALTDTNGNTVETTEYAAFGQPIVKDAQGITHSQSTVGNAMLYTGTDYDPETGLHHMGYRYQDQTIGRFYQEDPLTSVEPYFYAGSVGEPSPDIILGMNVDDAGHGSSSLYQYTFNSPTNWTDTTGTYPIGWFLPWIITNPANAPGLGDPTYDPVISDQDLEATAALGVGELMGGAAASCEVTGAIAGQSRGSRLIGLRYKDGKLFFTDKNGFFFAIDKSRHYFHIGPWRPF
jgi:RHS repeat-associated protein